MQRGQLHELFYPIYHLVVHEHAPVEEIAAVRHTVSDRPDIVQGGYHARFGIGDGLEDKVYPFRMVGNVRRELQTRFARLWVMMPPSKPMRSTSPLARSEFSRGETMSIT